MNLNLENIAIGYHDKVLISNINAQLKSGDVCVLLGKNGSGKTTLLKTILKFIPSLEGTIYLNKTNINNFSANEYAKKVAVVLSGRTSALNMTTKDFLIQGRFPYHNYQLRPSEMEIQLMDETIDFLHLEDIINEPIRNLSDGNFQKVSIGRALIQNTELILFDEPLSHLDVSNQQIILNIIHKTAKEKKRTVIFSTHDWNQSLQIANQLWLLKNDNFYSGNTEDLAMREELIPYFAPKDYYFDYDFNQFRDLSHTQNSIPIKIESENANEDAVFWLSKALAKENYNIENESEVVIKIKDKDFVLIKNGENFKTSYIHELIEKLKQ